MSKIELNHVSFEYIDKKNQVFGALEDVSSTIEDGSLSALSEPADAEKVQF